MNLLKVWNKDKKTNIKSHILEIYIKCKIQKIHVEYKNQLVFFQLLIKFFFFQRLAYLLTYWLMFRYLIRYLTMCIISNQAVKVFTNFENITELCAFRIHKVLAIKLALTR